MSCVVVVDQQRQPLAPVHPGRTRYLLRAGYVAVWRRSPFTRILTAVRPTDPADPVAQPSLRLKVDPGSKTTGLAVVNDLTGPGVVAAAITPRGQQVHDPLDHRRVCRRSRRQRQTRYRPPRFNLRRRRGEGWLPPSLESRLATVLTWVHRCQRFCPIGALRQALVRFDPQLLQDTEISAVASQQGQLAGYEVRECLLEKCARRGASCGATDLPREIEYLVPQARGGADRVSNLTLAWHACNVATGPPTAAECGHPQVQAQAKAPLKNAAAVNTSRWALWHRLTALGLGLEAGTGGRTKWNRTPRRLPKTHWLDAAGVGASTPTMLTVHGTVPLWITAQGRHSRQMCRTNAAGFPDQAHKATSVVGGLAPRRSRASQRPSDQCESRRLRRAA